MIEDLRELSEEALAAIGGRVERLRMMNMKQAEWLRVSTILAEMMIQTMTKQPVTLAKRDEAYLNELFDRYGVM